MSPIRFRGSAQPRAGRGGGTGAVVSAAPANCRYYVLRSVPGDRGEMGPLSGEGRSPHPHHFSGARHPGLSRRTTGLERGRRRPPGPGPRAQRPHLPASSRPHLLVRTEAGSERFANMNRGICSYVPWPRLGGNICGCLSLRRRRQLLSSSGLPARRRRRAWDKDGHTSRGCTAG